jgi:hypothetical protein
MDLFVSDGSFNRARMPLDALDEKMRLITSCTGFQRHAGELKNSPYSVELEKVFVHNIPSCTASGMLCPCI